MDNVKKAHKGCGSLREDFYEKISKREVHINESKTILPKHRHATNRKKNKIHDGIRRLYTSYNPGLFTFVMCTADLSLVQGQDITISGIDGFGLTVQ